MAQKRKLIVSIMMAIVLALTCGIMAACEGDGKVFTVSFDSNGGSAVQEVKVNDGEFAQKPADPTRENYVFGGWKDENGNAFVFESTPITKDITLKASWDLKTYTVNFETDGGNAISPATVQHGSTVQKPADPVKTGFVFIGWYADSAFTRLYDFSSQIMEAKTLYARFVQEISEVYSVRLMDGETLVGEVQTNAAGMLENLPQGSGDNFLGWWMSDSEDAEKLTCQYIDHVIDEDLTLYAVYEGEGVAVSVNEHSISWSSKGVNKSYNVKITDPTGTAREQIISTLRLEYDFASRAAGEYVIEVTYNGVTTTAYYNNKALARVSLFEVEGFVFRFNAVKNATSYSVAIDCGNINHENEVVDLGSDTYYDFSTCDMAEGGIKFVVTASADGYMSSVSREYVLERNLVAVTNIKVVATTEQIMWDEVENADRYEVQINEEEPYIVTETRSKTLKHYAPGTIAVKITALGVGYNGAETEYTYNKVTLKVPTNIDVQGKTLMWDVVDGATGYKVNINGNVYNASTNTMEVPDGIDQTDMSISVQALGATSAQNSMFSDVQKVIATLEGEVRYESGKVYWSNILGALQYEVKINDAEPVVAYNGADGFEVSFDRAGDHKIAVRYYASNEPSEWEEIIVTAYTITMMYNFEGYDAYATVYRAVGDALNLPTKDVTLPGYIFKFWSAVEEGVEYIEQTLVSNDNLTLYAQWNARKYKVYLAPEGGKLDQVAVEVTYRDLFQLPVPTNDDGTMIFAGWYAEKFGEGIQYTDYKGDSITAYQDTGEVTLYASWAKAFEFVEVYSEDFGSGYSVTQGPGLKYAKEVTIPVYYLGRYIVGIEAEAFADCKDLTTVNIPDTIQNIEMGQNGSNGVGSAFRRCPSLNNVNVYVAEEKVNYRRNYASHEGVLFGKNSITDAVEIKFLPIGRTGSYTIPAFVDFKEENLEPVRIIPWMAIKNANISELIIPHTITSIDYQAISYCYSLTNVEFLEFPEGEDVLPLHLGEKIFYGSDKLTKVNVPGRIAEITPTTFSYSEFFEEINITGEKVNYQSIDGIVYNITGDTLIYAPRGRGKAVTIPSGVNTIADYAFANPYLLNAGTTNESLKYYGTKISSVSIPGYVTEIGEGAFRENLGILSISFDLSAGNHDLVIGKEAFYGCAAVSSLTLPENLVSLGAHAFGGIMPLREVTVLGAGELNYEADAFASFPDAANNNTVYYYLTTVNLGAKVESVDIGAVFGAGVLNVNVDANNNNFASNGGMLYNKDITVLLFVPFSKSGEVVLPSSVTSVSAKVFNNRLNITSVKFGKNLQNIGIEAFKDCTELKTVIFEDGGTSLVIGDGAFSGCSKLTNFVLPNYVTVIGSKVFYKCNALTTMNVPASLKTLGDYAFESCANITSISFEEGVEYIGLGAFKGCSRLTTVNIPASAENLGVGSSAFSDLFEGCSKLTNVTIAGGSTTYSEGAFYSVKDGKPHELTYALPTTAGVEGVLTIPESVVSIAPKALLNNANIKKIVFAGDSRASFAVGEQAFAYMTALQEIELPKGLTVLSTHMFLGCSALKKIVIPNTVTSLAVNIFLGCSSLTDIIFEEGGTSPLRMQTGQRANVSELGVKAYHTQGVFNGCTALKKIVLPERLTNIGSYAFATMYNIIDNKWKIHYSYIESVTIPSTVQTIENYAFYQENRSYGHLKEVIIVNTKENPSKLTTIGNNAFTFNPNLKSFNFVDSISSIGNSAFSSNALQEIVFSENSKLTSIGNNAFTSEYATRVGATRIILPPSLVSLGTNAFEYNGSLTHFEILNIANAKLSTIGSAAFRYCANLTSITLPASITTIGANAFRYDSKLSSVTFLTYESGTNKGKSSLKKIDNYAFGSTALTELRFPTSTNSTITIGTQVLEYIYTLKKVYLSKSVTNLSKLFAYCFVEEIEVAPDHAVFKRHDELPLLTNANGDSIEFTFGEIKTEDGVYIIDDNLTKIGAYAFRNQVNITKVVIPYGVQEIGDYAFQGCVNLKEIVFMTDTGAESGSTAISSIGIGAFKNCTALESIDLSRTNVSCLMSETFYNCHSLKHIELPKKLTTIGDYEDEHSCGGGNQFAYCYALEELNIPDTVTVIDGWNVFESCYSLKELVLPKALHAICGGLFNNCTGLKKLVFQSDLDDICDTPFGYNGYVEEVVLYSGMTFLGYGEFFSGCSKLKKVTYDGYTGTMNALPVGIESLPYDTFYGCSSLTNFDLSNLIEMYEAPFTMCTSLETVVLNDDLSVIGDGAFFKCSSLKNINWPKSLTFIGPSAFEGCAFEEIVLPEGIINFSTSAANPAKITDKVYTFAGNANLRRLVLPSTIQTIGGYAFSGCSNLESITYNGYTGEGNALPEACVLVGNYAFGEYLNPSTSAWSNKEYYGLKALKQLSLPGVTNLGEYAFYNGGFETISLPRLVALPKYMCYGCESLKNIELNPNVTTLADYMFAGCSSLESINLPEKLIYMGVGTFQNSGLVSIKIPQAVSHLVNGTQGTAITTAVYLFDGCAKLESVELSSIITGIGAYAFNNCIALETITYTGSQGENILPDSLTKIGNYAFAGCASLKSIDINNVTVLNSFAFAGSGLESFAGANITSVPQGAFKDCASLETFDFSNITSISSAAFAGAGIKNATISSNVTSISGGSFTGMENIESFTVAEGNSKFTVVDGLLVQNGNTLVSCLNVPDNKQVVIPNTITSISSYAFSECGEIEVYIPNSVISISSYTFANSAVKKVVFASYADSSKKLTTIGSYAFDGATKLEEVVLPDTITSIATYAFRNTTSLKKLTYAGYTGDLNIVSNTVTSVSNYAFQYSAIPSISLPKVTSVSSYAFANSAIKSVSIPSLTSAGTYMFYEAECLESVDLGNSLKVLSDYMFYGSAIQKINLPTSLTYLGKYAFAYSGLTELVIPESIVHIGPSNGTAATTSTIYSLCYMENLKKVVLPSELQTIGGYAFSKCYALETVTYTGYEGEGNALPESLTIIGGGLFSECTSLKQMYVNLPNITAAPTYVFQKCTSLEDVYLNIPALGTHTFYNSGVINVEFGSMITTIPNQTFANCSRLETFKMNAICTSIGSNAFQNCTSFKELVIEKETAVASSSFSGCGESLTLKVKAGQYYSLSYWSAPSGVKVIWNYDPEMDENNDVK